MIMLSTRVYRLLSSVADGAGMLNVLACVTQEHDIRLVLLAGLVCLLACLSAFNLIARGQDAVSPRQRWTWITAAAVVTGSGVWATHFVAMLAYRPGLPLGYDVGLTVLSVAVAIAITWLGCAVSVSGPGWSQSRHRWSLSRQDWAAAGGAVAGAGIGGMHFIGMAAMRVPADVGYDPLAVFMSVALGMALARLCLTRP